MFTRPPTLDDLEALWVAIRDLRKRVLELERQLKAGGRGE
jgi:hypothetical protein